MRSGDGHSEAEKPKPVLPVSGAAPCPRCRTDLSRLPGAARFCSRCGLDLMPDPAVARLAEPSEGSMTATSWDEAAAAWQRFRRLRPPSSFTHVPDPPHCGAETHSLMLTGYAN